MKKSQNNTQTDIKTMEKMVADLQLKLVESQKTIESKDNVISALHHQLFVLKNTKFGRKSEKLEQDKQLDLGFDEAELLVAQEAEPEEITETKTVTVKKKKPGRKPMSMRLRINPHWESNNRAVRCITTSDLSCDSHQKEICMQILRRHYKNSEATDTTFSKKHRHSGTCSSCY